MKRFRILLLSIAILLQMMMLPLISSSSLPRPQKTEDLYSSLIGVQYLAHVEQQLVTKLVDYKQQLTNTLDLLNNFLDDYKQSVESIVQKSSELHAKSLTVDYPAFQQDNDVQFISEKVSANPLVVFKLLRRFVFELEDIQTDIKSSYHEELKVYLQDLGNTLKLPEHSDLDGAAEGLLRLQETYQLPTAEMVKGVLIDTRTGCELPAFDMWYIGSRAISREKYATGLEWLYQAYQKVIFGDESMPIEMIIDSLSTARTLHNDLFLEFKAPRPNVFTNLVNSTFTNIPELFAPPAIQEYPLGLTVDTSYDLNNFNALCRGEQLLPKKTKGLRCYYLHKHSPFNVISPLKVEMLQEIPLIYQVYDLVSDNVMEHVKRGSLPHLKRSKVIDTVSKGISSDVRVSSVAWLLDRDVNNKLITQFPRNIKRATGLECEKFSSAEDLQISCYGSVGGYYVPHLDALLQSELSVDPNAEDLRRRGDRVATIMFYLSDVELGGGTAFPRVGVAAKPVKGSAVIWYNLKLNGDKELLMLHGGCPVLYGNKWVANKWIRMFDQHHIRKCSKNQTD